MGIKTYVYRKKLNDALEDNSTSKVFEILSQDKKMAGEFLNTLIDSENFTEIVKEAMTGWKIVLDQNQLANGEVTKMIQETRSGLQNYLDENVELLSREERQEILAQMIDLAKMMIQFDKDNKNFLLTMAGIVGTGIAMVGVASLAVIAQKQDVIDMAEEEDADR